MKRLAHLICTLGFLALPGAALADDDYLGGFEGRWEGPLKAIPSESYSTEYGLAPERDFPLAITVKNQTVSVFSKGADGWREVKSGHFQILAFKTTATVTAIDSSNEASEANGWVESWNLTITHRDRDSLLVTMARSVNNYAEPAQAKISEGGKTPTPMGRFFTLYFGEMKKVAAP